MRVRGASAPAGFELRQQLEDVLGRPVRELRALVVTGRGRLRRGLDRLRRAPSLRETCGSDPLGALAGTCAPRQRGRG
jgi:hypothetical protein